jgi:glycosyltransferase involved in cell wall biosynthesis
MTSDMLHPRPSARRFLSLGYWLARRRIAQGFDASYYRRCNPDVAGSGRNPLSHFMDYGWREGRNPASDFDSLWYLKHNPDVAAAGINPYLHYLRYGRAEGRPGRPEAVEQRGISGIAAEFDGAWYASCFPDGKAPKDPLNHYLTKGWREGFDPNSWFSTRRYLARNPDVVAAGVNPFVHYLNQGRSENRPLGTSSAGTSALYEAQAKATAPGPDYEEFDPKIAARGTKQAKVIAYYLPQFHAIAENDENWGKGFTEWRNVARALPRFKGHHQPRLPRDLGFYSLDAGETYRRQIEMAAQAGIHAFCFYHYWFNGRRVLETPVERMLADPTLDFPFVLMWANENWTRTWDGQESQVLLSQDYRPEDDEALVADFARHFADPRYMRVNGRPLLFIYRPGSIPDAGTRIAHWREMFRDTHGTDPIIAMAQGFGDSDPRAFGLDGAIEFPPHKLALGAPTINARLQMLDANFTGHVIDYDHVVSVAASEPVPDYPLIRCTVPHWDNEARRPARGFMLHGSTPAKFRGWMDQSIEFARENPFHGEPIVAVNAWNEWAEGAYLEPDVMNGAAYLNALSEAVHGCRRPDILAAGHMLLVGHDANRNGAQTLLLHLGRVLTRRFGIKVEYLLTRGGPMLDAYRAVAPVTVLPGEISRHSAVIDGFAERGFSRALTNTTAAGPLVPILKQKGFAVISLVHELPRLIETYGLAKAAQMIAGAADHVVFPAEIVRDGFTAISGPIAKTTLIRPQGLYRADLLELPRDPHALRQREGLPEDAKIVIGMGFGDLRKGIDRFCATALAMVQADDTLRFVWVGDVPPDIRDWVLADLAAAGLADRLTITGHTEDVALWLQGADLFFLTSREDPFPSVVLEAMALGLPVVGYKGCGGCDELIRSHGALVDPGDFAAALAMIARLLAAPPAAKAMAAAERRKIIAADYAFDRYAFDLVRTVSPDIPALSVVVPNYNYARYLPERLDTIFRQTLPLRDVIVLDDASTDDSLAVIEATAKRANRDIRLLPAAQNSGSPFHQWRSGMSKVTSDYVWIAEADDLAEPDLAERLVRALDDSGADLAFADMWQIDEAGRRLGDSYRAYLEGRETGAFAGDFTIAGRDFLTRHLAVKNVILNASGVVFRTSALKRALTSVGSELDTYAVAGDWRLYAEICLQGGGVAYVASALNGHRRHATSVTHALKAARHLAEIEQVQGLIAARLPLGPEIRKAQAAHLAECGRVLGVDRSQDKAA